MIREGSKQIEKFFDGDQGVLILADVSREEGVVLEVGGCLRQSPQLQQVDKVKIFQPVGALAVGQFGVEPSEELVEVGAVAFGGGLCEAVEGFVKAGKGSSRVPAVFFHLTRGVQWGQVDGDTEKIVKSFIFWISYNIKSK